jgi:hypothetical protein
MDGYVSVISTATALVAVIIGPIVSWKIAKKQIRATTVTASRQQWINNFRDTLADFLAKTSMCYGLAKNHYADGTSIPRVEQMVQLNYRIHLLINPNDADHQDIASLADFICSELRSAKTADENSEKKQESQKQEFIKLSQKILKCEWKRIREGK